MKLYLYLTFIAVLSFLSFHSYSQENKNSHKKMKVFSKQLKTYKFIPSGTFSLLENGDSLVSIRSFFMSETETTNKQYLDFVNDIQTKFGKDSSNQILPDTNSWRAFELGHHPEYYFRHPAFQDYPVVGLTYKQAKNYCIWLTEKLNKNSDKPFKRVIARLPLKVEWEYAAGGGISGTKFPWESNDIRDSETGQLLANFKEIKQPAIQEVYGDTIIKTNTVSNSLYNRYQDDFTEHTTSYQPNTYGLYNMAGNVSEFVYEKGILKGGSFNSTGYYLNLYHHEKYEDPEYRSAETGFRIVIQIVEY